MTARSDRSFSKDFPISEPTLKDRVVEHIVGPAYRPAKLNGLARQLDIPKGERKALRQAVDDLLENRQLRTDARGIFRPPLNKYEIIGTLKRTARGTGFVRSTDPPAKEGEEEIFIAPEDIRDAFTGDVVVVQLSKRRRRGGQRCGRIVEVTERAVSQFVGTYSERKEQGWVKIDGRNFEQPVPVGDPGAKGATDGDKVVIEMLRFPTWSDPGEAVLTKVLGNKGEPGVDTEMIVHEFNLPEEFPEEVLEDARRVADEFDEEVPADRTDLTEALTVTIDPVDARDFDDAISLARDKQTGHWFLMVHIADVAHFVKEKSPLDTEAKNRGTSVYLPGRVIPMLPELISNGLASLQQGRVRYTKTAIIEFDPQGVQTSVRFANSAIRVDRRFAYEQVMPIVKEPENFKGKVSAKIRKLLGEMHELAMILRQRRFEHGAIEMDLPEVKIDLNKRGEMDGAHEVHHDTSHQIIEEFMLAANIAVATELERRDIPFLRRVHPDPDPAKLSDFASFAELLGQPMKNFGRPELQRVLRAARGTPMESALNYALLRSFKQAQYSPEDLGHYALGEEAYCHFTSPIRRYPDLTVHRIIDRIVSGRRTKGMSPDELIPLGDHCTRTEKNAEAAERELIKLKLLTFMESRKGEEFHGRITGVEKYGAFVRGIEIPAEGLLTIEELEKVGRFYLDRDSRSLIDQRSETTLQLGDQVTVTVETIDLNRRELNWGLVAAEPSKKSRSGSKSRKRSRSDRGNSESESGRSRGQSSRRKSSEGKSTRRSSKSSSGKPAAAKAKKSKSKSKTGKKRSTARSRRG